MEVRAEQRVINPFPTLVTLLKGLRSTDVREVNPNKKKFLKAATFSKPPNETFKM